MCILDAQAVSLMQGNAAVWRAVAISLAQLHVSRCGERLYPGIQHRRGKHVPALAEQREQTEQTELCVPCGKCEHSIWTACALMHGCQGSADLESAKVTLQSCRRGYRMRLSDAVARISVDGEHNAQRLLQVPALALATARHAAVLHGWRSLPACFTG